MEFPDLGRHCFQKTCKQLDFLPMKCDACSNIFCRDHIHYNTHNCPESYKKDNQVPVCPLCNNPVPIKKDELPDAVIGRHIDNDCQSDPARKRRKVYTNRCSHKGCKQKELVPVVCDKCHKNFCLKHRHELDHECKGFEDTGRGVSKSGAAAVFRFNQGSKQPSKTTVPKAQPKPQNTPLSQIGRDLDRQRQQRMSQPVTSNTSSAQSMQAGLSEDEALAQAIQMSMAESHQQSTPAPSKLLTQQEQDDLLLAQAIAASQEEARREERRRVSMIQNYMDMCKEGDEGLV